MDFSNSSHRLGFAVAVIIIVAVGAWLYFGKNAQNPPQAHEGPKTAEQPTLPDMSGEQKRDEAKKEVSGAVLHTSFGEIEVVFFRDKAPKTVENFVKLVEQGFYNNTKFHRVIRDFMIQGGDPLSKDDTQMGRWGTGGPGYQFADEINDQRIVRGVLAMANAGPNTNGSQFFIVTAQATPWLDGKHTVFGKVVSGLDVVEKIGSADTGPSDIPKTPIVIQQVVLK